MMVVVVIVITAHLAITTILMFLKQLQTELVEAREEVLRLRNEGHELLNAYQRKTERAHELLETIADMEQHYERKCQENEQHAARIAELEVCDGPLGPCVLIIIGFVSFNTLISL